MKITTWNVNGLRALLRKDGWNWVLAERPDVVCLQEIKARPDQLTLEQLGVLEDGYHLYWNPAQRPGYSGVLTAALHPPTKTQNALGVEAFDGEGRLIQSRHLDFSLFNVYFPNGKRSHERLQYKLDFYAWLLEFCDGLHDRGENLIICGDVNTAHQEIDLKNPKQNQNTSGFLPEERAWVQKYLDHGFVDAFRALYPDKIQYSWWTYRLNARERNIGWRLDYFLVSESLMARVKDVIIHEQVLGSDHCPVTLVLD